ncbi:MAG: protoheme IX farnesyltransferase, partial [Planctomycetota bacterium]
MNADTVNLSATITADDARMSVVASALANDGDASVLSGDVAGSAALRCSVSTDAMIDDAGTTSWRDWLALTKPRIVVMILIVVGVTGIVAAGWGCSFWLLAHTLVGTAMVAGSSGVMNQVWERRIDKRMQRTSRRPIPSRKISPVAATVFGMVMGSAGVMYLVSVVNAWAAGFALLTWASYVLLYTPMKTRTTWNTTVGAIAGALPMMIGYVALGGQPWDLAG